jgi:hypothetical protein
VSGLGGRVAITAKPTQRSSSSEALFIKHLKAGLEVVKADQGTYLIRTWTDFTDPIPNEVIAGLIPKLFTLHHYGFHLTDFPPSSSSFKLPASLQIRSWEANDLARWVPPDQLAKLEARRAERVQARAECLRLLAAMDDIEKLELLKGDKAEAKAKKEVKAEDVKEVSRRPMCLTTDHPESRSEA